MMASMKIEGASVRIKNSEMASIVGRLPSMAVASVRFLYIQSAIQRGP
jgi:hypothetical protein